MANSDHSSCCPDCSSAEHDCLHRCLADFALLDMASKARLLQSLSSYLSCVSTTMCASTEDFSLSAWVGTSRVRLRNVEVIELHNLLVGELQYHTDFLTRPHSTSYIYSEAKGDGCDEVLSRTLHLEVISETLRCCIRILPLVDCFDTSVSFSGAALLDGLMQQLCSPRILLDVLSRLSNDSKSREQEKCARISSRQGMPGCRVASEPKASNESFSIFTSRSDDLDVVKGPSRMETEAQRRVDTFLAILEVYMDELLLCPDLGARFLAFQDEECLFFKQKHLMSSFATHTGASLEAAFVHAVLSCLSKMPMHGSRADTYGDQPLVCNLSLPAGLLLLETLAAENVPAIYMSHMIKLVTRVLNNSTSRDLDQVTMTSSVTPEDCSCWSGGVDWSYCLQRVPTKRDPMNWVLKSKSMPSVSTIHFASSIFEQAMLLYRRLSTSSYLSPVGENGGQSICQPADNLFLGYCVTKYRPVLDLLCNNSELDSEDSSAEREYLASQMLGLKETMFRSGPMEIMAFCSEVYLKVVKGCVSGDSYADQVGVCERTTDLCEVKEKVDRDGASSLVSAVLQLGISSLDCITTEIEKMLRLSSDVLQLPSGQPISVAASEDETDRIFAVVSVYISSFFANDSQGRIKHHDCHLEEKADSHSVTYRVSCGQRSLISSVGKAILFFTNVFCGKVQSGAPEELLEDYFHLLESLVALLLVADGSKRVSETSEKKYSPVSQLDVLSSLSNSGSEVPPSNFCAEMIQRRNNPSSWLGAMVLRLQNMLQELSSQQRHLPEFFLDFVLEQISRGDGLNVVAMAFSGSFKRCLDGRDAHQSVMRNVGSVQSKGLVNQILELALQKPNRISSISCLIGYITNVLEDLLPITATLSLHEVSESLSCYEHIAAIFTLACQLAVSEQSVVTANDHECHSWLFSRMCDGIERLFAEGTTVARMISNCTALKSTPEWLTDMKMTLPVGFFEERQFQSCSGFLVQIDQLRRAVDAMRHATDWFLIAELEFSSVSSKARTFLEAFSRLRMMVDKPVRLWRFHIFLQEQLSRQPLNEVDHVEEEPLIGKQEGNSKTDGTTQMCDRSWHMEGTRSEINDSSGGYGHNGGSVARTPTVWERETFYPESPPDCRAVDDRRVDLDGVQSSGFVELPSVTITEGVARFSTVSEGMADMPPGKLVVDSVEPSESRKRPSCSSTTLAIVRKLTEVRQLPCKKAKRDRPGFTERYAEVLEFVPLMSRKPRTACLDIEQGRLTDCIAVQGAVNTAEASNPYIESVREQDSCQDDFDDLKDFIVCKKGRNYSTWLKKRQSIRRRLHTRTVFKRLQEKRDLLLLLDLFGD